MAEARVNSGGLLPEIQGLRAIAVGIVVIFHLWPNRLTGGYVGVDVFFVISGFLITAHLLREVDRTSWVRLPQFWARRARRLLPASLLVLLCVAIATPLLLPPVLWDQFFREVLTSAIYVENWQLAGDSVDYLAAGHQATAMQHYWSLSAEEQFYLIWPVIIIGAILIARRVRRWSARRWIAGLLGIVVVTSFAYSVYETAADPNAAYFVTPTRAWEFGLGGMLGIVAARLPVLAPRARALAAWLGVAAIAASALLFSETTPFPGFAAALPVAGTLAVIAAGTTRERWSFDRLSALRPIRYLGDISYSIYLWHWPLIVFAPYVLGAQRGTVANVLILATTLVLAALSKHFVEDPVRDFRPLVEKRPRWTFVALVVTTALVGGTALTGSTVTNSLTDQAVAANESRSDAACFGARAVQGSVCGSPYEGDSDTRFLALGAAFDRTAGFDCVGASTDPEPMSCTIGDPDTAAETVALIGDSHAASWLETIEALARQNNWAIITYFKYGCPPFAAGRMPGPTTTAEETAACAAWVPQVLHLVASDPRVTTIFTSYRSDIYWYQKDASTLVQAPPLDAVEPALTGLAAAGKRVVVLRAVPTTNGLPPEGAVLDNGRSAPDCIADTPGNDPCAVPRSVALAPDYQVEAADALNNPRIQVMDLTDSFCDAELCHSLIGGVIVYWDGSHITRSFSRSLDTAAEAAWQRLNG